MTLDAITMKFLVLLSLGATWAIVAAAPVEENVVNVDDEEIEEVEYSNTVHDGDSDTGKFNIEFNAHGENFQISAEENTNIKPDNVPVMFVGEDGVPKKQKPAKKPEVYHGNKFYGSSKNGTVALLKRNFTGLFSGHLIKKNVVYELQETDENTMMVRKKRESPLLHALNLNKYNDYSVEEELETLVSRESGRVRRSATTLAGVEALVMVDYSLWKHFYDQYGSDATRATNEIKQYFAYIIHGVDIRYQNIKDPDVNIFLTLAGYVIADSPNGSPFYDSNKVTVSGGFRDQVDVDRALTGLKQYVSQYRSSIPAHDHAFSFSDLDFTSGGSTGVAGYAPVAGICSSTSSLSITEAHGGFNAISTAAHELGHNLGARHDGPRGNSACAEVNNIMDPDGGRDNLQNAFHFSDCSVQDFKNTLSNKECVKDTATHGDPTLWAEHMARLPGQIYSADQQCQDLYGQSSTECGQWIYDRKGYDKCSALWCVTVGNSCGTKLSGAARGTDCGTNRWCINGQCVTKDGSHTTTRKTPTGSPGGDSNTPPPTQAPTTRRTTTTTSSGGTCTDKYDIITYSGVEYSCPQMARNFNDMCSGTSIESWCCASCRNVGTLCQDNSSFSVTITYSSGRRVTKDCAGFVSSMPQYCANSYYKGKCCASCQAAGY